MDEAVSSMFKPTSNTDSLVPAGAGRCRHGTSDPYLEVLSLTFVEGLSTLVSESRHPCVGEPTESRHPRVGQYIIRVSRIK